MYDTATTHPNQPDPPPTQHTRPPATCRPGTRHRETVPAIQSTPPDHEVHRRHPWPGAEATTSTVLTCDATTPATTSRALSASRSQLKHGTNQVCPPTPNRDQMQPELPHPRDNVDSATVDRERRTPIRIFLSYGHDRNTPIVLRIKDDLEAAGPVVWIDSSEIKAGDDWRRSIVDGLMGSEMTLSFLSRHSVRNPGVCLDELAIALHVKSGTIATVLVESEAAVDAPVSISQVQWLDMHDWTEQMADGGDAGEEWYRTKLAEILTVLSDPKAQRLAGEIERLDRLLRPTSQEAEIGALVDGFVGREWLRSAVADWSTNAPDSRLFWISGAPGTGKRAFAGGVGSTK